MRNVFNSTFRIRSFLDSRRRGSSPCLKAGVSAAKNLIEGQARANQQEGRPLPQKLGKWGKCETCTRNIGLAAVVGLACVVPLLLTISPWLLTGRGIDEFTTIDDLYYSVAVRVSQGQVPYRDFLLEYPIGSLPQIVLPILAGRSVPAYRCAYIAEMLLINALMLQVLAWQVGRREGLAAVPRRLAWYFLCYFFLCRMIVSRIDLVPALLAFLAAVEWFGSRPIVGGILAGLGGLVKIFPVLVVIPAGLRELSRPRETWLRGSIAFGGSSVLGGAVVSPGRSGLDDLDTLSCRTGAGDRVPVRRSPHGPRPADRRTHGRGTGSRLIRTPMRHGTSRCRRLTVRPVASFGVHSCAVRPVETPLRSAMRGGAHSGLDPDSSGLFPPVYHLGPAIHSRDERLPWPSGPAAVRPDLCAHVPDLPGVLAPRSHSVMDVSGATAEPEKLTSDRTLVADGVWDRVCTPAGGPNCQPWRTSDEKRLGTRPPSERSRSPAKVNGARQPAVGSPRQGVVAEFSSAG